MYLDALIIGQGLAGSLLAWTLIQRQYRVLVVDPGQENASQVAAGLINPITGKRLVKHPQMDAYLTSAHHYYRALEQTFGQAFLVELPMLRVLQSTQEQEYAQKRLLQADYHPYISNYHAEIESISSQHGILQQTGTGYLQTLPLLTRLRQFLIARSSYIAANLDYADIHFQPILQWREYQPKHIIFCEGHQAINNPWFGDLPFQLAKGEILTAETADLLPEQILNFGKWLIPLGDNQFKTGATFQPHFTDNLPSEAARLLLLAALHSICPKLKTIHICEHKSGIRPATLDRQPFVGSHPRLANLHIFNGFGSKGSLLIPWHCQKFADFLSTGQPLDSTITLERYHATHFPA